ncbi:MAG: bifunctional oligoribonuclease/PAP phosphatase NrnA [Treponema sp.]|nr:bifunctional oligoribonuclease/PAP phosphatase NrnA [Treponema sp.]
MFKKLSAFIERRQSFILCTHDPADADGLGAELALDCIIRTMGKKCRIINSSPVPGNFMFMDPEYRIETWNDTAHDLLPEKSALLIADTSDEYNIGVMKNIINRTEEVFVLDHHEPAALSSLSGLNDSSSAATSELAVEFAMSAGIKLDPRSAAAAYTGIVYDTGSFSYSKTTKRTFRAALYAIKMGAVPYQSYRELNENSSTGALLLQKKVFTSMELLSEGRIAVQILRKEDLVETGARFEDAEGFINIPLKSKDIAVSVVIKENIEDKVRCSMRSKGTVNVSKIAQGFGGGGHVSAAGFKCPQGIEQTLSQTLPQIIKEIEMQMERP